MSLELLWKKVLTKKSFAFLLPFLFLLSFIYRFAIRIRHFLYDKGWLRAQKVNALVISIGNIAVGGTGKTPFVQLLSRRLEGLGKVAVLSRGYKSQSSHSSIPLLVNHYIHNLDAANLVGDEPLLLLRKNPDCLILSGPNRVFSATLAIKNGAELLILDDGFQHRALQRDVDVVLLDSQDPFCRGYFLPRGKLRDVPEALKRASLIALNHLKDEKTFEKLKIEIKKYSRAPVIGLKSFLEIPYIDGDVAVFCAIANPERFIEMLTSNKINVKATFFKADHEGFSEEELQLFWDKNSHLKLKALLCTEKDGIKLSASAKEKFNILEIPLGLKVDYNLEAFEEFIENIRNKK